jgi:hypothetical protein
MLIDLIAIITGLTFKHFVADFILQRRYQFMNKGTYGHPGGILHAGIHGLGTLLVLVFFLSLQASVLIMLCEMVIHYHIDWAKVRWNKRLNLDPKEGNEYWFLFGFDQYLHHMTYIGILILVIKLHLLLPAA